MNNRKPVTFPEPTKECQLQGKLVPYNLERESNTEIPVDIRLTRTESAGGINWQQHLFKL